MELSCNIGLQDSITLISKLSIFIKCLSMVFTIPCLKIIYMMHACQL